MKKCLVSFLTVLLLLPLPRSVQAQSSPKIPAVSPVVEALLVNENPLFLEDEVLHFTLSMDIKTVLKDRGEERTYHPAAISYHDSTGAVVAQALKVKVRGNRRRDPAVCGFPPLLLNFSRSAVENTVFGKVNKLKMVTHCTGDEYVLREYLAYKMYNILTDTSFRVRLCRVTYQDVQGKKKPETKYAFIIEDEDAMAERLHATVLPDELVIGMRITHIPSTAVLTFFQYMIGNTDWSVPYRHNIKMLDIKAYAIPVPYDFDYAGCVSAPYASPPPELEISSVKQRLFRGYSYPDSVYAQVRNLFNLHKPAIYGLYADSKLLDEKSSKSVIKYLEEFYTTLNNAKKFEQSFVEMGQRNEKGGVVVKGLD